MNQKTTGRAFSMPAGLTLGAAISMGITLVLAAALAMLVNAEKMPWESIGYGIIILLLMASFMGALTAYKKIKRQRLMVCMATGGIYFCLLLSITALFFGGQYQAVGVTAALILAGSGSAALLGLSGGRPKKVRAAKILHR